MTEAIESSLDAELRLTSGARVEVWQDEFHIVHLRVGDEEYENVRPVKTFPISGKAPFISFLSEDGKELVLVDGSENMPEDSRSLVETLLEKTYFVPRIIRVFSIKETWGISRWQVETDCGFAAFEVTHRERIRRLPRGRYIIVDADDNRYEIEDIEELDLQSQRLIARET